MRRLRVLCIALLLGSCFPFGEGERTIIGNFALVRWEGGSKYYIVRSGEKVNGGGLLNGSVTRLAWSDNYIIAQCKPTFNGDVYGWMVIDVAKGTVTGPSELQESALRDSLQSTMMRSIAPSEAWQKLDPTPTH